MTLSWSLRRKLIYSAVVIFISLLAVIFIWFKFFTATPTCTDGKQDGTELGVDCGGSCVLVCSAQAKDPIVLWARAFPNGANTYTAAAYVQNNNGEVGAKGVPYVFQLYDADNKLVAQKEGTIDIPPVQTIPIVEPNIDVGGSVVTRTLLSFTGSPVWDRVPHDSVPSIRVTKQSLSTGATRLDATVANNTLGDELRATVVAVLFDSEGVARAASKSIIPVLAHTSTQDVVFTWPQGVPDVARAEISILPSF